MTYKTSDIRRICEAISVSCDEVLEYRPQFEAAAHWFRLDTKGPKRIPPSQLERNLISIAKKARRLLDALGIDDTTAASDGPSQTAIFQALEAAAVNGETEMLRATERVGRLVETLEGLAAASDIERWANEAATETLNTLRMITPAGHQGDAAANNWIAAMIGLYCKITGRDPGTSVGMPTSKNEGEAAGPLIRFLAAAGKPLGLEYSTDAWRARVRLILENSLLPN